jgi:hypothetical protein
MTLIPFTRLDVLMIYYRHIFTPLKSPLFQGGTVGLVSFFGLAIKELFKMFNAESAIRRKIC